jgi:predicted GIY-YIG superfamily endonuclease
LRDLELSAPMSFCDADWTSVPAGPGVYVILDRDEVVYVGMAGRNGQGGLRKRLKDHASGQIVNMFAQYLFLARAQFLRAERITHPREAKAACRQYIAERCALRFRGATSGAEARALERQLKTALKPSLNP